MREQSLGIKQCEKIPLTSPVPEEGGDDLLRWRVILGYGLHRRYHVAVDAVVDKVIQIIAVAVESLSGNVAVLTKLSY